jgi:hypothetical protein
MLMKDYRTKQGLLTICNIYKLLKGPIDYDISTITNVNPMSHTSEYTRIIKDIGLYTKDILLKNIYKPTFSYNSSPNPIFATPKASANGPNAMGVTSILDAIATFGTKTGDRINHLAKCVFTQEAYELFISLSYNSYLEGHLNYWDETRPNKGKGHSGRLHFLQEGGGKTRVICIPDIWSQMVLKPIHDHLMMLLKRFPCDGTFSHPLIAKRVRKFTKNGGLFCFDLKAATDRMPVDLQQEVLKHILGEELSILWRDLLVDREFYCKGQVIRYGTGQPMGFLSSWPAMTITHHAIINYCKRDKSFYAIIGDDMAMESTMGAERYQEVLKILGMEISYEKSIIQHNKHNLGEIAKRLFINGGEISPIPPDILIKSTGTIIGFLEFTRVFSEKLHHSDPGGFSDSEYQDILGALFHNSTFRDDLDARVLVTFPILEYFSILPRIPPLKGVRSPWKEDIPQRMLRNSFDRFILETANQRTNSMIVDLEKELQSPVSSESSQNLEELHLYKEFKKQNKNALKQLIRRINTVYIDEEADSFAEGPIQDIRDILSHPSPLNGIVDKIYLSKRELKLRNTHSLIQQFYDKNKFFQKKEDI